MANRTVKDATSVKGTDPQHLVEKITRSRIYESRYWKEDCFGLTAELLVDKAMELKSIGGTYGGNVKPAPFLCLVLKMLQIQPEKDIIIEFIKNEDFKYVRALGAIYMRLTGNSLDVYKYLEPLYIDYRKMKRMNKNAKYELIHMDEFIDELLHSDRVCDIALPRIQKRQVLEELNELEVRKNLLEIDDVETSSEEEDEDEEEEEGEERKGKKSEERRRYDSNSDNDDRKRRKERRGRDSDEDVERRSKHRDGDKKKADRRKYVDYDNPNSEDELPRYRRSPTPEKRKKRRSRSRSRSADRHHKRKYRFCVDCYKSLLD